MSDANAKATMTYRGPSQNTEINDGMNCMLVDSVFRTICGENVQLDKQFKAGKTRDSICTDCASECFEDKTTTTGTPTTTATSTPAATTTTTTSATTTPKTASKYCMIEDGNCDTHGKDPLADTVVCVAAAAALAHTHTRKYTRVHTHTHCTPPAQGYIVYSCLS